LFCFDRERAAPAAQTETPGATRVWPRASLSV